MQVPGFRLGIDFGTSNTVAVLRWPDGRAKPLLFDGSPLLPSAVYAEPAGGLAVGRDAVHSARLEPSRFEPNPKRRVDDGWVLLGDREVSVLDLIAAVLSRVADEARRTAGGVPANVIVTCPAAWATPRRRVLGAAAVRAGLGEIRLVEEPVAAATYFARVFGARMPPGAVVVVYDFGGGTFDVSLVERAGDGFRPLDVDGRGDIGGLDLDAVLVRRLGDDYGSADPAAWQRLVNPTTAEERRQRGLLWDDVRMAKERLSRFTSADVHVTGLDRDAHLTRDEFDELARPLVTETVQLTVSVLQRARVPRERIAGLFLVGGSSRIPLVATLVHRGLGIAPTVIEQPELVVAEGSVLAPGVEVGAGPTMLASAPVSAGPASPPGGWPAPVSGAPVSGGPVPTSGPPGPTSGPPGPVSGVPMSPAPAGPRPMNPPQYPTQQYSAAQQHPALSARTGPPPVVWAQPPAAQPTVVQPKAPGRHGSGWIAALAALVVLAGLGVVGWHYWPRGSGGGGTPDGHNSSSPTGRGDPDLPDMLYDGTSPVLHTRDGNRVPLPAGGAVKVVIGVPSGWMVSRAAPDGTTVAQYLDRNGGLVKQSGPITGYYVNATGKRVALASTDQQVAVWDLDKSTFPAYTTAVPAGAKPIGMVGDNVLIRVGGGDSYDYWAPAQGNYKQTPSTTALIPLGGRAQDGKLVGITKPDGCLSLFDVENGFTPTGKPLCDPNLTLTRVASTILPVLSPDGRFLVVRRGGDTVAVDVDAALAGNGDAFHRLDLGADIESVAWGRSVLYAKTTAGRYLRCQLTDGACATIDVPADSGGLTPTKPVVRFGL